MLQIMSKIICPKRFVTQDVFLIIKQSSKCVKPNFRGLKLILSNVNIQTIPQNSCLCVVQGTRLGR